MLTTIPCNPFLPGSARKKKPLAAWGWKQGKRRPEPEAQQEQRADAAQQSRTWLGARGPSQIVRLNLLPRNADLKTQTNEIKNTAMPKTKPLPSTPLRKVVFGSCLLKHVCLGVASLYLFSTPTFGTDAFGPAKSRTQAAAKVPATQPVPTSANVAYGTDKRQVLDFYQAKSDKPTPLVFHVHGGGWVWGDKKDVPGLEKYLAAGISVVSVNYRYSTQAQQAGVTPPVKWPMEDIARSLQFVRSKAAEWNIDKARIGATGSSAGACSSLWLAFHKDLADTKNADPVARESTRLWCAAVSIAQTSLDPKQLKEWTPNSKYGGHAFGFMPNPKDMKTRDTQFAEFLAARESILPWIMEYSPYEHATSDDPPIYLSYDRPPAMGQDQKDPTHTANFGVKLREKLGNIGVECELVYPGAPGVKHPRLEDYLIEKLKATDR